MKGNLWFFCLKLWVESWILCKFPFYYRLLCTSNLTFDRQKLFLFPFYLCSFLWSERNRRETDSRAKLRGGGGGFCFLQCGQTLLTYVRAKIKKSLKFLQARPNLSENSKRTLQAQSSMSIHQIESNSFLTQHGRGGLWYARISWTEFFLINKKDKSQAHSSYVGMHEKLTQAYLIPWHYVGITYVIPRYYVRLR